MIPILTSGNSFELLQVHNTLGGLPGVVWILPPYPGKGETQRQAIPCWHMVASIITKETYVRDLPWVAATQMDPCISLQILKVYKEVLLKKLFI